jgi:hypothetical protein
MPICLFVVYRQLLNRKRATLRPRMMKISSLFIFLAIMPSCIGKLCCAGSFTSRGRGAVYPPIAARGKAFEFVMTHDFDTNRVAQRAVTGDDMGTVEFPLLKCTPRLENCMYLLKELQHFYCSCGWAGLDIFIGVTQQTAKISTRRYFTKLRVA